MEKPASGLWVRNPETPEGKYLVKRRDGSIVEWPHFVLGARDPSSPPALRAYADAAEQNGMNAEFVADIRWLAGQFEDYFRAYGSGDPDRGPHRKDDPETVALMRRGRSA